MCNNNSNNNEFISGTIKHNIQLQESNKSLKGMLQSQMNANDNLHKTIETIETFLNLNIPDKEKIEKIRYFLNS